MMVDRGQRSICNAIDGDHEPSRKSFHGIILKKTLNTIPIWNAKWSHRELSKNIYIIYHVTLCLIYFYLKLSYIRGKSLKEIIL